MTLQLPVPVSFEFFPPNTPVGSEKLKTVVLELAAVAVPLGRSPRSATRRRIFCAR